VYHPGVADPLPEAIQRPETVLSEAVLRVAAEPETALAARRIAALLSEPNAAAVARALALWGTAFVDRVVSEALAVEASGGMLVVDGSRRRTPGGVFFYL
jgi:hypothetical protein